MGFVLLYVFGFYRVYRFSEIGGNQKEKFCKDTFRAKWL